MTYFEYTDRVVDSTDNNEYADGDRDETLWEDDLVDTEIPEADDIIEAEETKGERPRPEYNEEGFREDIGK